MLSGTMTLKPVISRLQQLVQGIRRASQQACARKTCFPEQAILRKLPLQFPTFQLDQWLLKINVVHGCSPFSKAGTI
jgi:hypothetical protein